MASLSITRRRRRKGVAYQAEIVVRDKGEIVHYESKLFERRAPAKAWGRGRLKAVESPQFWASGEVKSFTLGDAIRRYLDEYEWLAKFGRSKSMSLRFLQGQAIARTPLLELTSDRLIRHAIQRRAGGAGPSTVKNDLIWTRVVLKTAAASWKMPVTLAEVEDAMRHLSDHRVIGRPKVRTRRPTLDELEKLSEYFRRRQSRMQIPMHKIMWFAVHSSRRQDEICRLLWSDNNDQDRTGIVRKAKHPRDKENNDREFRYTEEAWEIVQSMPREGDRIFPFNSKSVSAAFTRACKVLEIDGLCFHDLRHEATSRLFEAGYSIPEVQQFTLHEDWNVLRRYTHLRPRDVKLR